MRLKEEGEQERPFNSILFDVDLNQNQNHNQIKGEQVKGIDRLDGQRRINGLIKSVNGHHLIDIDSVLRLDKNHLEFFMNFEKKKIFRAHASN